MTEIQRKYLEWVGFNDYEIQEVETEIKNGEEILVFEGHQFHVWESGYNKANEWHYVKDVNCYEDLPQNKDVYYAYVVNVGAYDKPTIERKLGCFAEFEFDVMAYHVIAWKEIVFPELKGGNR